MNKMAAETVMGLLNLYTYKQRAIHSLWYVIYPCTQTGCGWGRYGHPQRLLGGRARDSPTMPSIRNAEKTRIIEKHDLKSHGF